MNGGWLNPDDWWPAGQGRSFDLDVPRAVLVDAVEAIAERYDDEFDVIVCERSRPPGARKYSSDHRVVSVNDLLATDAKNQFIRSRRLTPAIPASPPSPEWDWSACALNGLILVQSASRSMPPRLGVMPRVAHRATGERREHADYDRLFRALKRRIQRATHSEVST